MNIYEFRKQLENEKKLLKQKYIKENERLDEHIKELNNICNHSIVISYSKNDKMLYVVKTCHCIECGHTVDIHLGQSIYDTPFNNSKIININSKITDEQVDFIDNIINKDLEFYLNSSIEDDNGILYMLTKKDNKE